MKGKSLLAGIVLVSSCLAYAKELPSGFVYLKEVDPSIIQELRYAGWHNFLGRPVEGYLGEQCILTREAAEALKRVQASLKSVSLSLKVYDCYRPQRAVNDFMRWSRQPKDQLMKQEFYPRVNKAAVFELGYLAEKSGHSRGSTMDLTIVALPLKKEQVYHRGQKLVACYAPVYQRFGDNSVDMGTGYDCIDEAANVDYQDLSSLQKNNRLLLNQRMQAQGFVPYAKEWWHFTLKAEPYPNTYFDFVVR